MEKLFKNYQVLGILIILKIIFYYSFTEWNHLNVLGSILLFTGLLVGAISSGKSLVLRGFYLFDFLVSLLMFVQMSHYGYYGYFASVYDLGQVAYAGPVADVVYSKLNFLYFFIFADLILYFLYRKFVEKKTDAFLLCGHIKKVGLLAVIGFFLVTFLGKTYYTREFFSYHVADLYQYINQDNFLQTNNASTIDAKALKDWKNPEAKGNKYHGLVKGRNLINIQVESLSAFVINRTYNGQELTPNLNRLIKDNSLYFSKYYQMISRGHTSDAEFVTNNSLYPSVIGITYDTYPNNTFYGMPWIMRDNGYKASVFHGYDGKFWNRTNAYPAQGYERFYSDKDFRTEKPVGFGINDSEFFQQAIPYLKEQAQPFYAFMITLSSHVPFEMPEDLKKIKLKAEDENTEVGRYLQAINFTDAALGEFISELKRAGIYENSVITLYGDHYAIDGTNPTNKVQMERLLGKAYEKDEMHHVPLIVHIPGLGFAEEITRAGSQLDYMPTMLNLFGIKNEKGLMFGQDIINAEKGFVALQGLSLRGAFVDDEIYFDMSTDMKFQNSKAMTLKDHQAVDLAKCELNYSRAVNEPAKSDYILKNDLMKDIIAGKKDVLKSSAKKQLVAQNMTAFKGVESLEKGGFIKVPFEWKGEQVLVKGSDMTLEQLMDKVKGLKDTYVVVECKDKLGKMLDQVAAKAELRGQFIPQIDAMEQYTYVESLGFEHIIINTMDANYTTDEIIAFVEMYPIIGIKLPKDKLDSQLEKLLKEKEIKAYL